MDAAGTTPIAAPVIGTNPGPAWHVKGTGDFNGDGHADILWQNDNGSVAIWLMNAAGTTPIAAPWSGPTPGRPGTSRAPATSTATVTPTSSGRTTTAASRPG